MVVFDVVIIGGGIIGCTLARSLAGEGMKVAVVERGAPGEEASSAAAGMLSPSAEAEKDSPLFALCRASLQRYGQLAAELKSATGIDPQYRTEGTLLLFANEQERQAMLPSMEWQRSQGIPIQELSQQELRECEPRLAEPVGGFYLPQDHQIDNRLLMSALVQSCRQGGVEFALGEAALEVECNGHGVTGLLLEKGRLVARRIVNASGAWAAQIRVPGLAPAPIRPVKGHIVTLECTDEPFQHVIRSHRVYMVPRRGGRVIVGSTMEEVGFDKTPRAAPLTRLLQTAQEFCPILEQSKLADLWAGLRPAAPDGLPLLGPTSLEGYFVALGHFRNGILLAPITAEILSGWLIRGESPFPIEALLPRRFAQFLCG